MRRVTRHQARQDQEEAQADARQDQGQTAQQDQAEVSSVQRANNNRWVFVHWIDWYFFLILGKLGRTKRDSKSMFMSMLEMGEGLAQEEAGEVGEEGVGDKLQERELYQMKLMEVCWRIVLR